MAEPTDKARKARRSARRFFRFLNFLYRRFPRFYAAVMDRRARDAVAELTRLDTLLARQADDDE